MNEIYMNAVLKFGLKSQTIKCVEELSELQKELCKLLLNQGELTHVAEEIADVEIMLEQIKQGLVMQSSVDEWKTIKLGRLQEMLQKEE